MRPLFPQSNLKKTQEISYKSTHNIHRYSEEEYHLNLNIQAWCTAHLQTVLLLSEDKKGFDALFKLRDFFLTFFWKLEDEFQFSHLLFYRAINEMSTGSAAFFVSVEIKTIKSQGKREPFISSRDISS